MRKALLTMLTALFAIGIQAQSSWDTAEEITELKEYDLTWDSGSYYWLKYTPTTDQLVKVTSSSSLSARAFWEGGSSPTAIRYISMYTYDSSYNYTYNYYYDMTADSTYYFRIYNYSRSVTVTFEEATDITNHGNPSQDDPMEITGGGKYFLGNHYGSSYDVDTLWCTYTAADSGVVKLHAYSYMYDSYVICDGETSTIEFSSEDDWSDFSTYEAKFEVEEGKTYTIGLCSYYMILVDVEFTQPTEGSEDLPFSMVIGDNTIPAEAGTYYYTWNNGDVTGYATITGPESVASGNSLGVWEGSYGIGSSWYASALSDDGSYDVEFELYYSDEDYTVIVTKGTATDAAETFTLSTRDYKAGETESNPIVITEWPYSGAATPGTYTYYEFTVPEDSDNMVFEAEVTSEVAYNDWYTYMYVAAQNSWSGESGQSITMSVDAGTTYDITWSAYYETDSVYFTANLRASEPGDLITNPLTANDGDNVLTKSGTVYYTYTATSSGKFMLDVNGSDMEADFPQDENEWYTYDYTVDDGVYSMEVDSATSYYIIINNAEVGDTFTISIGEYGLGESKATAISLNEYENGTYTFTDETPNPVWFSYVVQESGKIVKLATDLTYNYSTNTVYYYLSTSSSTYSMTNYYDEDGNYNPSYSKELACNAGDTIHIYIESSIAEAGDTVSATERDAEVGESADNPYVLEVNGDSIYITEDASTTKPVWIKVKLGVGNDTINFSSYPYIYWYQGYEAATSTTSSSYTRYTGYSPNYYYTFNITEQDDYYIKATTLYEGCYVWATGTEPTEPTYDLTYTSIDPNPALTEDDLDTEEYDVESLSTITITYDSAVYVADTTAVFAFSVIGDTVNSTAVIDGSSLVITFDSEITSEGEWLVRMPQGTVGDSLFIASEGEDGHANDDLLMYYYIVAPEPEMGSVTVEPADSSTVDSLSVFTVKFNDWPNVYRADANIFPYVTDEEGNKVAESTFKLYTNYFYSDSIVVTLDSVITSNGTYTLVIPGGLMYLQNDNDMIKNDTITFTYFIEASDSNTITVSDSLLIDSVAEYSANQVLTGANCSVTLGNDTWTNKGANSSAGEPYYAYITGSENPKDDNGSNYSAVGMNVPTTGAYVIVRPSADGTVEAGLVINSEKPFYVAKGSTGEMVDPSELTFVNGDGETVELDEDSYEFAEKFYGTVTFDAEADEDYYIFCTGSKIGFYGVVFTYETTLDESTEEEESEDTDEEGTDTDDEGTDTDEESDESGDDSTGDDSESEDENGESGDDSTGDDSESEDENGESGDDSTGDDSESEDENGESGDDSTGDDTESEDENGESGDDETDGINNVSVTSNGTYKVYTLTGMHVMTTTDSSTIKSLPEGMYIINGKKIVVK